MSNQSTIYRQAASLTDAEEALLLLVLAWLTKLSTEPTPLAYGQIAEHYAGRRRSGINKGASGHKSIAAVAGRLIAGGWVERSEREQRAGDKAKHDWLVTAERHSAPAAFAWPYAEALIAWAVEQRLGSQGMRALLRLCRAAGAGGCVAGAYKTLQATLVMSRHGIVTVIEQCLQDAGVLRVSDEPEAGTGRVLRIQLLTPFAVGDIADDHLSGHASGESVKEISAAATQSTEANKVALAALRTENGTHVAQPSAAAPRARTATSPKAAPARTTEAHVQEAIAKLRPSAQEVMRSLIKAWESSLPAGQTLTPLQRTSAVHQFELLRDELGDSTAAEHGVAAAVAHWGDVGDWPAYARTAGAKRTLPKDAQRTNADAQREREAAEAQARADARRQEDDARWQAAQQHAAQANARKVTKAIDISLAKLASMTAERELTEQQREQTDAWVERMATKMVVADLADNEFDAMGVLWGAINERKLTLALAS